MNFNDLKIKRNERMLVASHRGVCSANIPCNTLEAFSLALRQGADIIELDVTKSLDGQLFVFHPFMDFPHLKKIIPMQFKHSNAIKNFRYVNNDLTPTKYPVSTFDEALDYLKDKCIINIDKFWSSPKIISEKLDYHNMRDKVLIKSYYSNKNLKVLKELVPDVPYMLITRRHENGIEENLIKNGVNLVAEELIFRSEDDPLISNDHLKKLKSLNLFSWVNTIVYNYKDVISAGKTDDLAILGNEDLVWGWLRDKGVDVVQTDWVRELIDYLTN